jgi:DNA-binding Lrp family transcriptional regulator
MMTFDLLSQQLINAYQRGFPICSRPFLVLAKEFDVSERRVINCLEQLKEQGVLSRLGPVFDHQQAGASTLAAIAAPSAQLDGVAAIVNSFEQVNHNYAREHHYNLWFVVTAPTQQILINAIKDIERATGYPVLMLPMEKSYHIDLSFQVCFNPVTDKAS